MFHLNTFCRLYQQDTRLPVYLYENGIPLSAFPDQTPLAWPPETYTRRLMESDASVSFCATDYGVYFGSVARQNHHLILGPVSAIPHSDFDLHRLYADYSVPSERHGEFRAFVDSVEKLPLNPFLEKLIFLNYCLNEEYIDVNEIIDLSSDAGFSMKLAEQTYEKKENLAHNESYKLENLVLTIIRTGRPEDLLKLHTNLTSYNPGILAPSALRQLKNNLIVTTTLATRAAIDGGLDYDTAYQLSDLYIQKAEHINDADTLYTLMGQVSYDFARRVRENRIPVSSDDLIQKAIRYVQQNVNCHITVADVAAHVGFSRSYFSTYFKQQLGFSLGDFILRCKLEESRLLLQFTEKSLTEISNYLCFSSQSHFQTAFKKQYHVTPLQYRKNPV